MELRETLPLRSVDDLKWVPGLDTQRIEEIKQQGLAYVKGVMEDQ
jgi:DNA uptake protein ComE-like DNA-binding protein